ncbi:unnamed protein product [Prunus armeniaca]
MLNNLSLLSWPLHHRRKLFIPPIHNVPVLAILVVLVAHAMVPSFTTSDLPLVHQPVLLFQVQASPITGHPAPPSPALAFWGLFRHRAPLFNVGTANNLAILLLGAHCLLYLDSGATNHMTNDARTLTNVSSSSDQVLIGNGPSLPITHSSNVAFSSDSFAFNLSDVLLVPSLHKNLLSIAQLTHDHPGRCSDVLYPVLPSLASKLVSRSKSAFSSTVSSSSFWHRRLGHPSNKVLSALVSQSLLGSPFRLSHNSCSHCA